MGSENYKIIKNFIDQTESDEITKWVESISHDPNPKNLHIASVRSKLNGNSYMIDLSKTRLTNYICEYQSGNDILDINPPRIINTLVERISLNLEIPSENHYVQILDTNKGGMIKPHYDSTVDGFINYKCNLCVLSDPYQFNIDGQEVDVNPWDLYCFEASLYKHWTSKEFNFKRILLSFGFLVPYSVMGRNETDPRVRLSQRIKKYFQDKY